MPYLNLDLDFFDHPKTLRLIGLLGKGSEALPIRLWCKTGKFHAKDGKLTGYSAQEIEALVGWWGVSGKCIEALLRVGFLEKRGEAFIVHDWAAHSGHIHAFQRRASAMAKARWRLASQQGGAEGSEGGAPDEKTGDASSNATSNANTYLPTNLPAVQGRAVHSLKKQLPQPAGGVAPKEVERQRRLLNLRMPFGELKGAHIINIPADRAKWLLEQWEGRSRMGAELREALALRVKLKEQEKSGAGGGIGADLAATKRFK